MRLFVGVNIPKKQRTRVHRSIRSLREDGLPVRWIDPDNFHVTLKFLGDVRRERIDSVVEALDRVGASTAPFTTTLGGFGAFPTVRRPRVIWVAVDATPEFRCLKQDLEWALGEVGFDAETRAFHPHVTLGRAQGSGGAGAFRDLDRRLAELDFTSDLRIHSLDVMRSHLTREGAKYSVLSSVRLAA